MADPYASLSTQRRSTERDSTRRLRELEKLAKKGVPKSAMEAEYAEVARLRRTEPTTSRPEGRELERQAQRIIDLTRRAEVDPNIDFKRDVAPLRSKWFADVTSSNTTLSAREQQMMRDRFRGSLIEEPKITQDRARKMQREDLAMAQATFNLKQGKRQARQQRQMEKAIPELVDKINPVLNSNRTTSDKIAALTSLRMTNPMLAADPRVSSLFNSAVASVTGKHQDQRYVDNQRFQIALSAARTGSVESIQNTYTNPEDPLGNSLIGLAEAVRQGQFSKRQADQVSDAIERGYKEQDYYRGRIDTQRKSADDVVADYARIGKDESGFDIVGEDGAQSASTVFGKRAQINRMLDILISVAGTEFAEKNGYSKELVAALEPDNLDAFFLKLQKDTLNQLRIKRESMDSSSRHSSSPQASTKRDVQRRILGR